MTPLVELQTKRLRLIALDRENLRLSLEDAQSMERNLGLNRGSRVEDEGIETAVRQMLAVVVEDEARYLWSTHWQVVLREQNRIVGGLCFKGPPNEAGEVEIGYGTSSAYRRRGLMTEAVQELVRWAFGQPLVLSIVAETDRDNFGSHRVLRKCGFAPCGDGGQFLWWKIRRSAAD